MLKTFQFRIQKSFSDSDFLFTFNVYHMDDKHESDLVMVSNESETDSNPRKWHFLQIPQLRKVKLIPKLKKPYDRNDTRKIKNEWFKQFEWLQLGNGPASDCSTAKSCESDEKLLKCRVNKYFTIKCIFFLFIILLLYFVTLIKLLYCK